jgi:L-ascorbate metabolism protein UlaG (beta-lactamase superfamily)
MNIMGMTFVSIDPSISEEPDLHINVDTHIDHFSGANPIDLSHPQTAFQFNEACEMLLRELKRRALKEEEESDA